MNDKAEDPRSRERVSPGLCGKSSGQDPKAATGRRWYAEIVRIDAAMKKISVPGFHAVRMLAVAEREIAPGVEDVAVACQTELAIQLSMLRRVAPPETVAKKEPTATVLP